MITPQSVLQRVILQDVVNKCQFQSQDELDFFKKFTTSEGIQSQLEYLNTARSLKKFAIYHLVYNEVTDEFELNVDYFDKSDDDISWVNNDYKILKWCRVFKNEFVLVFSTGLQIGNVFKQKLPVIFLK